MTCAMCNDYQLCKERGYMKNGCVLVRTCPDSKTGSTISKQQNKD